MAELTSYDRIYGLQNPKYVLSVPLQKKGADPSSTLCLSNSFPKCIVLQNEMFKGVHPSFTLIAPNWKKTLNSHQKENG